MNTSKYVLFDTAIYEYLKYCKLKVKNTTYISNFYRVNKYILPYFSGYNLYSITKKDYLKWQYYINSFNFKFNYKSNLHCIFSNFFKFCIIYYDLNENIPKIVGNFKNYDVVNKGNIWSIDEFNIFIGSVDDLVYKTLFELLFFTGLRKGEALALKWNNIDFINNSIDVCKTLSKSYINGIHPLTTPKTKKSIRKILIDNKLCDSLIYLKNHYLLSSNNFNDEFFVFGGEKNISFTSLKRMADYYCKKSNVKRIKIHEFRHSHACLLFQNNIPIEDVSRRLGHSTLSMTMDIYLKYLPVNEKRVISTLNSIHKC